ncbi:MAG: M1 family metallopeptidase [Cytophagales bacterium]|nr:M1 family metallopeptidase [Bernardetiaceae bacterium]MDW8209704.1 M1 family metallopeptidase [Cytophagales bacterium]
MRDKILVSGALLFLFAQLAQGQYTRADTLRGALLPERACYDVTFYDLNLKVKPDEKFIAGYNAITFRAIEDFNIMQIDLAKNFTIDRILFEEYQMRFRREGEAVFIHLNKTILKGTTGTIKIYYQGKPRIAPHPPWDGGFTWARDSLGRHWIGVSCQGLGASSWWPCKDHPSDEPDSMRIYCEVPEPLICISNGNLRSIQQASAGYKGYEWRVSYPINTYNVTLNIAHYTHLHDQYISADGDTLAIDYYVLDYNKEKALNHFQQVKPMLACFEKHFGKYPFWRDGFALVETPYWGMEHQSAVAYGNNYQNNKYDFDFIIVHESAHEYFGNSLTMRDNAELWIHESFATYAEAVYLECITGNKSKVIQYLKTQQAQVRNLTPMIGVFGVNYKNWLDNDIYFKGTWMLHSLRHTIDNDTLWFNTLRDFVRAFRLKNISTEQVVQFFNQRTGRYLTPIFRQYLFHTQIPQLEYKLEQKGKKVILHYRWKAAEREFNMPAWVTLNSKKKWIKIFPQSQWQTLTERKSKNISLQFNTDLMYFQPVKIQ